MNVKDSIKKVGAVAASTLMVGMTMGAAQSLSEFPGMFTDDDGAPTAQVVVGSQGAVSDVVGAVNIAAALGQATVQTSEQTEEVSVETSGGVGWSASDGQTMDTRNDNLYFGDAVDTVRQTLTNDHLDALGTYQFTDAAGNQQDVEHYLYPGSQGVQFGTSGQSSTDPFLYVSNPSNVGTGSYLYQLQANFGEGLTFSEDTSGNVNDDVRGEEIELFGKTFTIGEGSLDGTNELILYGSSQEYDLETGESTTFTVNGNEHTLEVRAVTDSDTAAFYVDGSLKERDEATSFNVDGTSVRLSNVIQTSSQNSEGLVTFSIGSEEYRIDTSSPGAIEDEDGNDIEGTHAVAKGVSGEVKSGKQATLSSLEIYVGAADSDDDYVMAGESFQDPIFSGVNFHFGGLAPDAGTGPGEQVDEVMYDTNGDDTAQVTMTDDAGNDATVEFFYDNNLGTSGSGEMLADGDGDKIVVSEGQAVIEDEYFTADAGDFARLWEVTSVDREETASLSTDAEATVDLRDAVTGASVEVNLDADSSQDDYVGTEVIDGQTYNFHLNGASGVTDPNADLSATWDSGASSSDTGVSVGNYHTAFAAQDADSGEAVAFTTNSRLAGNLDTTNDDGVTEYNNTVELPSTESTDAKAVDVSVVDSSTSAGDATLNVGAQSAVVGNGSTGALDVVVGQTAYQVTLDNSDTTAGTTSVSVGVDADQDATNNNVNAAGPGSMVVLPEDDNDVEHAYHAFPGNDATDNEVEVNGEDAGSIVFTGMRTEKQLDSDTDMYTSYDFYGAHAIDDRDNQGTFALHVPNQQAVIGAGFTGEAGDLTMGGTGTGQGEVTYTGVTNEDIRGALPDIAKTDSQVTSSDRQNSNLILVGGPAVNTLVADLASQGETWTTDQWRNEHQDEALLQVVQDAFADGQHAMIVAGYSADDTRAAARYISEWRSNQDTLSEAGMQYSPSSQEAPR